MRALRLAALGATVLMGLSAPALANTYTFTTGTHGICSSNCASQDYGTITTTNITGGVDVSITLAANEVFIGNLSPGVMFALTGLTNTLAHPNPNGTITYGGSYASGAHAWTPAPGGTQSAGSYSPDGIGTYTYGLTWNGGNGASHNAGTSLDFHVLALGLTTASFTTGSGNIPNPPGINYYFAADIGVGCTGIGTDNVACANTGEAGATLTGTGNGNATPLPAALPLMGTVLGAGYLVSLFRRRRETTSDPFAAV